MPKPIVLVTGGAGFIGVNAADRFRSRGWEARVFDDLSRGGTEKNLAWLKASGPVAFTAGDIRDAGAVRRWVAAAGARTRLVLHFAAQVAVTTSVAHPRPDFEINALGSFNLLEAVRALKVKPLVLYASTNKVYGGLEGVAVRRRADRYELAGRPHGVPEGEPLDFHSPYGCSKGAADQYFHDYARIYGLPTVVFRQSCIYGRHQHGNEDQGWVAHFIKAALAGRPLTVYGDGRQVRDLLDVDDLTDLYERAEARRAACAGRVYNIGGGPENTLSLRELLAWLRDKTGGRLRVLKGGWRPGDQRVYVSDIRRARRELGWAPRVRVAAGLERLWDWLSGR